MQSESAVHGEQVGAPPVPLPVPVLVPVPELVTVLDPVLVVPVVMLPVVELTRVLEPVATLVSVPMPVPDPHESVTSADAQVEETPDWNTAMQAGCSDAWSDTQHPARTLHSS